MPLKNITVTMSREKAAELAAENIICQVTEFRRSLSEYQLSIFRTQLENAFEIGWSCCVDKINAVTK